MVIPCLSSSFVAGLRRSYGEGPLWGRLGRDEGLLALGREAIACVLSGSPEPFAADPEPKCSAMNRFQRILVRWDKKPDNSLTLLHFACTLIAFRAAGLFGADGRIATLWAMYSSVKEGSRATLPAKVSRWVLIISPAIKAER